MPRALSEGSGCALEIGGPDDATGWSGAECLPHTPGPGCQEHGCALPDQPPLGYPGDPKTHAPPALVTTPRTKVRGFSGCFPAGKHAGFSPKAPSRPRKTLTPYRQASAMLPALPRVSVWSFTHRTTRWNPYSKFQGPRGTLPPKTLYQIRVHLWWTWGS